MFAAKEKGIGSCAEEELQGRCRWNRLQIEGSSFLQCESQRRQSSGCGGLRHSRLLGVRLAVFCAGLARCYELPEMANHLISAFGFTLLEEDEQRRSGFRRPQCIVFYGPRDAGSYLVIISWEEVPPVDGPVLLHDVGDWHQLLSRLLIFVPMGKDGKPSQHRPVNATMSV